MNNFKKIMLLAAFSPLALASQDIDKTLEVRIPTDVEVEVPKGKVKIVGWDKAEVRVKGTLDDGVKDYRFKRLGGKVVFEINKESGWSSNSDTNITFYVPNTLDLEFEGTNTEVALSSMQGSIEVATVNGSIEATDIEGKIDLNTVNGSIIGRNLSGVVEYETVNGDIMDKASKGKQLTVDTINGEVEIKTAINRIELEGVNLNAEVIAESLSKFEVNTVNGGVDLEVDELLKNANIEVDSVHADVIMKLPTEQGFQAEVVLHKGGTISNQLSADEVSRHSRQGSRKPKILEFTSGKGDTRLEINSVSGDVYLKSK
ncbi:hypothetical protein HR060_10085 [Catenovulum sp. SM1970]|uniref:DUF4097 family beta strand repeat-containing protein n=1 Tax=Marinifaba aquimaris TaxID=2741323 RepID=UPI0015741811|nr:hypothetical protein [Marinifaba aquimaris]NTS77212.1 hypothetical protein [Marinifaba aquimaris]